jgi:hypothetical protein
MVVIEGFKRPLPARRWTMVPYPTEDASMDIHALFERILDAYAAYAGCCCGGCAD